jgi:hypothetical protein
MKINILLCDTFDDKLPEEIPGYVSMFRVLFGKIDNIRMSPLRGSVGTLQEASFTTGKNDIFNISQQQQTLIKLKYYGIQS